MNNAELIDISVQRFGIPFVIKLDGLCNGKGVLVAKDRKEALEFLNTHHPNSMWREALTK